MKDKKDIYITINHIDDFCGYTHLRVGDVLTLEKDPNNEYDDEAIAAYDKNQTKIGYVANSVSSVARGTYSAGRVYDQMDVMGKCVIKFITEEIAIAEIDNQIF